MQFQVPQFIEVEDKVFGPLTIRQFIYIAGGAGLCYTAYALLPLLIAIPVIVLIGAFAAALAFYKYNSRPFIELIESLFKFAFNKRLYIWKKEEKPVAQRREEATVATPKVYVPKLSESKLKELSWSLDIKENPDRI